MVVAGWTHALDALPPALPRRLALRLDDVLPVLALGHHPVDDARILRLERSHVVLRRLDRVLLRKLVAMVSPFLLLLRPLLMSVA